MLMNKLPKFVLILSLCSFIACVPARKLEELQLSYNNLQSQYDEMKILKEFGDTSLIELQAEYSAMTKQWNALKNECEQQRIAYEKTQASYELLNKNYKELVNSNENTKNDLRYELDRLDKQLDDKKRELFTKEASLLAKEKEAEELAQSLKDREFRVNELESKLAAQESAVNELKEKLTNSLIGYQNSGISVIQKNGKVYVSLDNSLLFKSGKTDIDWKGKTALLKVAESLQNLSDFDIMVEGHTDNVPMKSSTIQDNWDLSVLRATSVVRYLSTEGKLDPIKIIPSGRSKYVPIDAENTAEARAKNRRIEIILSPKLDTIMDILK